MRKRRAEAQSPVQHSTFPQPHADTQVLPAVAQHQPPAVSLPPLHRDPSTNPDLVALNMIRVCSQGMAEHWSATRLMDALLPHSGELHKRSMREQEGGATIARRSAAARQAPVEAAQMIADAVAVQERAEKLGVKVDVEIDPRALGKGLAQVTANAAALGDETMTFRAITDDMPDPRAAEPVASASMAPWADATPGDSSSPVRAGGAAPVPGQATEPEPLPHRAKAVTSFEADLMPSGAPMHGHAAEAFDIAEGDWLLHEGRWHQVVDSDFPEQAPGGDGGLLEVSLADGTVDTPHMTATVHVLTNDEAKALLADRETETDR